MPRDFSPKFIGIIPFVFVFVWSTGFIGAKYAMPYAEPFAFLSIRSFLTILILLLILFLWRTGHRNQGLGQQMIIGALIHGGYLGGVFYAIHSGFPAGLTALIVSMQPILTAFLSAFGGMRRISKREWFGLLLGLIGAALVILGRRYMGGGEFGFIPFLAVIMALFSISIGTVLQKRWGGKTSIIYGNLWQYLGALLVFVPISLLGETWAIDWQPPLIWSLLWLVFGLSVGATLLLMLMIREGEVAKVASYFYLVPPLVLIESWFLFDERLSLMSILGAFLVVIGVYLVVRPPKSTA